MGFSAWKFFYCFSERGAYTYADLNIFLIYKNMRKYLNY